MLTAPEHTCMSDVNAVFFGNCRDRYFTGAEYTPEVLGEGIWDCRIRSVARVSSSQRSAVRRERSTASRQTFMFLAQGLETMLSDAFVTMHAEVCLVNSGPHLCNRNPTLVPVWAYSHACADFVVFLAA